MIWTICGELYPSRYRAKAMALSTASNWLWNFLLAFFTPFITSAIDFRYGYVFAGCNVLAGLGVYFFVIEGQGRTLEEIDTMYLLGVKPWESAQFVMPSVEEMDAKTRQRLEETNPEMAIREESAAGAVAREGSDELDEKREGSEDRTVGKKEEAEA
jgi:MFS transporter, SP family, sugar:H+ symporter